MHCEKSFKTNADICMVRLIAHQTTLMTPWLFNLAMLLFNRLTEGILPKFNRQLDLCDNIESNPKDIPFLLWNQCSSAERRWWTIDVQDNIMTTSVEATASW